MAERTNIDLSAEAKVNVMAAAVVGLRGALAGKRLAIGSRPITFGRSHKNDVILTSPPASRIHAELRHEAGGYVFHDLGSNNGTWVNGRPVTVCQLRSGDEIVMGDETFRFETSDTQTTISMPSIRANGHVAPPASASVLRVTVAGGGPVGLSFALLLEHLMGPRVAIKVYDSRWLREDGRVVWKTPGQGNVRRQQVVTIQSRQYLKLPPEIQARLFSPVILRNVAQRPGFDPGPGAAQCPNRVCRRSVACHRERQAGPHPAHTGALRPGRGPRRPRRAACARDLRGTRSRSREYFADKFGAPVSSMYALDGKQVQDIVLGLRVKSELPDAMAVLLTVAQNRFLLNSLHGEGFLNMRLTDQEAEEAVGIDPVRKAFTECAQAQPCLLERVAGGEFCCATHHALFLPPLLKRSALWTRVQEGLQCSAFRRRT